MRNLAILTLFVAACAPPTDLEPYNKMDPCYRYWELFTHSGVLDYHDRYWQCVQDGGTYTSPCKEWAISQFWTEDQYKRCEEGKWDPCGGLWDRYTETASDADYRAYESCLGYDEQEETDCDGLWDLYVETGDEAYTYQYLECMDRLQNSRMSGTIWVT
jgi:hypothetical protein